MTRAIPPVPRRLGLSRELQDFLEALRVSAVASAGGEAVVGGGGDLAPAGIVPTPREALAPVAGGAAHSADLGPAVPAIPTNGSLDPV